MTSRTVAGEIVDRRKMRLFQQATIGGKSRFHPFEKEVVWVASSETCLEFWHGGQLLKEDAAFNDFYGYLTSMRFDDGMHLRVANKFKVDQQSTLELRLITSIFLTPYYEDDECRRWNSDALERNVKYKLLDLPSEYRSPYEEDYGAGLKTYYKTLERITAAEETTWSSQLSPEDNEKISRSFKEKWKNPALVRTHFAHFIDKTSPVSTTGVEV
ncbi:MAG: hypothetical protein CMK89_07680 [Pseudomonadales bacterium]|nr:hypothetical protein [Pseudomonadales bacterium]